MERFNNNKRITNAAILIKNFSESNAFFTTGLMELISIMKYIDIIFFTKKSNTDCEN